MSNKVMLLVEDWSRDYQNNSSHKIFANKEDAKKAFTDAVKEIKDLWDLTDENIECEITANSFEIYMNGDYACNHDCVTLKELDVIGASGGEPVCFVDREDIDYAGFDKNSVSDETLKNVADVMNDLFMYDFNAVCRDACEKLNLKRKEF